MPDDDRLRFVVSSLLFGIDGCPAGWYVVQASSLGSEIHGAVYGASGARTQAQFLRIFPLHCVPFSHVTTIRQHLRSVGA